MRLHFSSLKHRAYNGVSPGSPQGRAWMFPKRQETLSKPKHVDVAAIYVYRFVLPIRPVS